MDLSLIRKEKIKEGIFGEIPELNLSTLEHAYLIDGTIGLYEAKIPIGTYICERGMHKLAHMPYHFETFEVTNVQGHSNILFHVGNYNKDSEGCILLGQQRNMIDTSIMHSRIAFEIFMEAEKGVDSFKLTVQDN